MHQRRDVLRWKGANIFWSASEELNLEMFKIDLEDTEKCYSIVDGDVFTNTSF